MTFILRLSLSVHLLVHLGACMSFSLFDSISVPFLLLKLPSPSPPPALPLLLLCCSFLYFSVFIHSNFNLNIDARAIRCMDWP